MANRQRCVWRRAEGPCGRPAYSLFKGSSDAHRMTAYWCREHNAKFLEALGRTGVSIESVARVDYKHRAAYVAKSGRTFTTMDARAWLMEQGLVTSSAGRIQDRLIKLYGESH